MRAERYTVEQIVAKLRQAERLQGEGLTIPHTCKRLGISDQAFYRWRTRYGALKEDEAQRLKALEEENGRLRRSSPCRPSTSRCSRTCSGETGEPDAPSRRRPLTCRRFCRTCRSVGPAEVSGSTARPSATGASSPPTSEP
jgi:putative transposase